MNLAEIRIKCLELAHRSDLIPSEVVERAMCYEQYVVGSEQSDLLDNRNPKRPGRPAGKTAPL